MEKMNGKIVFFDIDGTLLGRDGNIPNTTKQAIYNLKDKGVYVAIATGRAPFMFSTIREELEIETFVSFNGQYVVFEREVIYNQELNQEELRKLVHFSRDHSHTLVFMDHQEMRANHPDHLFIKESLASIKFPYPVYDPTFFEKRQIYQTLLFCEEQDEQVYVDEFSKFDFVRWHHYSTDILPNAGSKAKGIQRIVERLGTSRENVYAFGDGLNDIQMLREVGTGVAMGNSQEVVKNVADYVTADVDEDGIVKGLIDVGLL